MKRYSLSLAITTLLLLSTISVVSASTDYAITSMTVSMIGSGNNATLKVVVYTNNPAKSDGIVLELYIADSSGIYGSAVNTTTIASSGSTTITYSFGGSSYDDGYAHYVKVELSASDDNMLNNNLEYRFTTSDWERLLLGWYYDLELGLSSSLKNTASPFNLFSEIPLWIYIFFIIVFIVLILLWLRHKAKKKPKYYSPPVRYY